MRVLYYWLTMGPYHYARMQAIQNQPDVDLCVVEATDLDDHQWDFHTTYSFDKKVLLKDTMLNDKVVRKASGALDTFLENNHFDIIVNGAGYYHYSMILPLKKAQNRGAKIVLWSESTSHDNPDNFIKSWIKKTFTSFYDGALVAGSLHQQHLGALGMNHDAITIVGNVVDNDFFEKRPEDSPRNGFLYVGRFLDIKNIPALLDAYGSYRKQCAAIETEPESLTLVGDGPAKSDVVAYIREHNLKDVHLTGLLQPEEVRDQYQKASVFVLPSTSEPWGLVVNEAMASGLPILISKICGCVPELIESGENGCIFNPSDPQELAKYMLKFTKTPGLAHDMGNKSKEIIEDYTPATYAKHCHDFFKQLLT